MTIATSRGHTTDTTSPAPERVSEAKPTPNERRRYARKSVSRPCKIFHCPSRRYLTARTCDLSSGGALIHLEDGRPISPGEEVLMVVDWTGRTIVPADRMVHGTVVRVAGAIGRHQSIGLQFAQATELAAVA